MNTYIGDGTPNGTIYGLLGMTYFDKSANQFWTKTETTASPYFGWTESNPDTP